MRRAVAVILASGFLAIATPALATEVAPSKAQVSPTEEAPVANRVGRGATQQGPVAVTQRKGKGSGFWTSDVPTPDRPYRWGYMRMGLIVMGIVGLGVFLLIRRAAREREARQS